MSHPQMIKTPAGESMVILPLKEYEQLREAAEDFADVRAYDNARQRLAAGEDELVPARFGERILNGENPIRVWREYRGLSVKELGRRRAPRPAGRANISAAYLSQLESGSRQGSLTTMKALTAALGLDLNDLI